MDPGGGNRELLVVGVDIAPVLALDRRPPTDPAELLRICLLDPAPPAPPLLPPLLLGTLRKCLFLLGPRDLGDITGNGAPLLDPREEVVAEERRVGMHPGESLVEMHKKSHPCHGVWSEI